MLPFKPSATTFARSVETPVGQDLQKIHLWDIGPLHAMVEGMRDVSATFVSLVEVERGFGSSLGMEILASEIALVSGDEHLGRVHSALGRALKKGESAALSEEGFSKIRRLERLLGEASESLDRRLGRSESNPLIPILIIGAIGIGIWLILSRR